MLAVVDRALATRGNAQTIGRSGELSLQSFLTRHLPNTLSARSGHFVSPTGQLSPQIDTMILDSRYPLLAQNDDGSVVSMLHSVVLCIEVKTNIRTSDIDRICDNSKTIVALANGVFRTQRAFGAIACMTFAYRSAGRLDALLDKCCETFLAVTSHTDLYLLRVPTADQSGTRENGVLVHLEPSFADDGDVKEWVPLVISQYTPLSDFYYSVVQDAYYCLNARKFTLGDIGAHIMEYMAWSTIRLSRIAARKSAAGRRE